MPYIHIYRTVGGLKINNKLFIGYSKRDALKKYREENGLKRKKCIIVDDTAKGVFNW